MANIARLDPIDEIFNNLLPAYLKPLHRSINAAQPIRMDIAETDREYLVTAEIPGVPKEAVEVSIFDRQVTISAETREEKDANTKSSTLLSERSYGRFTRSVTLPLAIDESAAEARHVDGVLYLTLPKKAASLAKKLTIH